MFGARAVRWPMCTTSYEKDGHIVNEITIFSCETLKHYKRWGVNMKTRFFSKEPCAFENDKDFEKFEKR